MLNIKKLLAFFAVFQSLQHCLGKTKEQLWGVRVLTGDDPHASTENHVWFRLYGEPGGWSHTVILKHHVLKPFQRSQIDYFYYLSKDVGTLKNISINVARNKDSWHLKRIELEKLDNHTEVRTVGIETVGLRPERVRQFYVFNCRTWFQGGEYATFGPPSITTDRSYILRVKTVDDVNAGTTNTVNVKFHNTNLGRNGVTGATFEIKPYRGREVLKRGTTATFQYITRHIGIPTDVRLKFKHQSNYPDESYACGGIELENIESDGKRTIYSFYNHIYMSSRHPSLHISTAVKIETVKTIRVIVKTDHGRESGTDKRVWIKFEGKRPKETGYIELDKPSLDDFRSGAIDRFVLTIEDVGPLAAVRLKTEKGDCWRLGTIIIDEEWQQGWVARYKMSCNCWVQPDKGVRLLAKEYVP